MTPVFRLLQRSSRALIICGVLLASQAFVVSAPRSSASDTHCSSLRKWAHAFENSSLTLDQIARFDRPHRLAIFNAVTPSVRSSLWREQLRRLESQSDLTAAQRALVAEGRTLVTPALYEREPAAMHAYQQFWARAEGAFVSLEHRRGWADIGAVAGAVTAAAKPPRKTSSLDWCQCNNGSALVDCGGGGCVVSMCEPYVGCGSSGSLMCNGFCV